MNPQCPAAWALAINWRASLHVPGACMRAVLCCLTNSNQENREAHVYLLCARGMHCPTYPKGERGEGGACQRAGREACLLGGVGRTSCCMSWTCID